MRWVILSLLVGCGDNIPEVPTTVVNVQVESTCTSAYCPTVYFDACSTYFPLVDARTTQLQATTDTTPLAALVQLQYAGTDVAAGDQSHADYTLAGNDKIDVLAALDPSITLYRIDASGTAVDLDTTHLDAIDGQTLTFTYPVPPDTVTETHVVASPRLVAVDASSMGPLDACCSVGRPADLGIVAAALLLIRRRRRRAR
jgi:hypothetical protein